MLICTWYMEKPNLTSSVTDMLIYYVPIGYRWRKLSNAEHIICLVMNSGGLCHANHYVMNGA